MAPRSTCFAVSHCLALALFAPALATANANADGNEGRPSSPREIFNRPSVDFVHPRRPSFKIAPAGGRAWTILNFEGFGEVDAEGRRVGSRTIRSLQDVEDFEISREEREVGGVSAIVTTMTGGVRFPHRCSGGASPSGELLVLEGEDAEDLARLTFETYVFLGDETARLEYGNETVEVFPGQMKFNIGSSNWPFCGEDHMLRIRMNVQVKGMALRPKRFSVRDQRDDVELVERFTGIVPDSELEDYLNAGTDDNEEVGGSDDRRLGSRMHRKRFVVGAGDFDFDMDLPEAVLLDGAMSECSVELDTSTGRMDVDLTFPYFNETMFYDPVAGFIEVDETTTVASVESEGSDLAHPCAARPFARSILAILSMVFAASIAA